MQALQVVQNFEVLCCVFPINVAERADLMFCRIITHWVKG